MKGFFSSLKDKVSSAAAEQLEKHRPGSLSDLNEVGRKVAQHTTVIRQALNDKATDAKDLAQRFANDERTQHAVSRVSAGLNSARQSIATTTSSVASAVGASRSAEIVEAASFANEEQEKLSKAIDKLQGKDKVGVSAEILGTAGGVAAGAAAASTVAGLAGATTILGSTSLVSAFGGVFVASTPVGWLVGTALLTGAAGYGLMKLVRSGANQDKVRQEIVERLTKRLESLTHDKAASAPLAELTELVSLALATMHITEEQGKRLVGLVERESISVEVAVKRLNDMARDKDPVVAVKASA